MGPNKKSSKCLAAVGFDKPKTISVRLVFDPQGSHILYSLHIPPYRTLLAIGSALQWPWQAQRCCRDYRFSKISERAFNPIKNGKWVLSTSQGGKWFFSTGKDGSAQAR